MLCLAVVDYLYDHLPPSATSDHLSRFRQTAICAPTLSYVAINKFQLHNIILINNTLVSKSISTCAPQFLKLEVSEIVENAWSYTDLAPKCISDVLEGVIGAVLVDSGWNWDVVYEVVTNNILREILDELCRVYATKGGKRRDPVAELQEALAAADGARKRKGCRAKVEYKWVFFNSQGFSLV